MEMSKRSTDDAESEALIAPSPSPFDSSTERRELEEIAVPTAVPVNDAFQENVSPTTATAAVAVAAPITDAVLDLSTNTTTKEDEKMLQDNGIIVKPEHDDGANTSYLPAATAIPSAASLIQHQHTISGQLRAANFKGILSTEEETAGIARAHRGIDEIQHAADEAVRVGNIAAQGKKGKKDEGLAVDHRIHHLNIKCSLNEKEKKEDEDVRLYGITNADGTRGYETKEYDTKEYTSEYSYDTTEYKSIYD